MAVSSRAADTGGGTRIGAGAIAPKSKIDCRRPVLAKVVGTGVGGPSDSENIGETNDWA